MTLVPTPSVNPVSAVLGDQVFGSVPGYPILHPLGPSFGAMSTSTSELMPGLTFMPHPNPANPNTFAPAAILPIRNNDFNYAALSLLDFNNFRVSVATAIDILDQKIRDILDVQAPNCE